MAQLVKRIRTEQGDLQIDYNALANLPDVVTKEYGNTTYVTQESGNERYVTYEYGNNTYITYEHGDDTYVTKEAANAAYMPRDMACEKRDFANDSAAEDAIIMELFSAMSNERQKLLWANKNGGVWLWIISKAAAQYGSVIAYKYSTYGTTQIMSKSIWNGTLSEWSMLNPEMQLNIEYRTMEYWLGKPVYTKIVSLGNLPNNTRKSVVYSDTNDKTAIRCSGVNSEGETIPLKHDDMEIKIYASNKNIHVTSNYDASSMTGHAQVWYVKE